MIYKAVEVIWIFSAGRDGTGIEGTIRGPRGPKNHFLGGIFTSRFLTRGTPPPPFSDNVRKNPFFILTSDHGNNGCHL